MIGQNQAVETELAVAPEDPLAGHPQHAALR